jgi:dynein heavy chain
MEDEVKTNFKTLKDMKCDKKSNTYVGLVEETKKWLTFLPLVTDLSDESMRPRHWG